MDLHQLKCFVAVAEELHFGRAAQRLSMLPSALGRHVRMLEEDLGTRLFIRTTRKVSLSDDGAELLDYAQSLLEQAEQITKYFRARGREHTSTLTVGAIDSASSGFLPMLLHDFRSKCSDVIVHLVEEKSLKLLPRLLSGSIDIALIRPPEVLDENLEFELLFQESAVVAVPEKHALANHDTLTLEDLQDQLLIVPEKRTRPHSHNLTMNLFADASLHARTIQIADEKQTIINLVAAEIGIAIVPRVLSRLNVEGVRYLGLEVPNTSYRLPLGVAWLKGVRDPVRNAFLQTLRSNLKRYQQIV